MSGYTAAVKAAVDLRDDLTCQRCGKRLRPGEPFSRHHRYPRGMGGGNRAHAGRLAVIVTLCGSATTPGSCHEWVERNRALAYATGWLLRTGYDPETIPALTVAGALRWYTDTGERVTVHTTPEEGHRELEAQLA